jgi:hypothetical protein
MKRSVLGLAVIIASLIPAFASAQEAGKVGVTMGFPASVGIIWHVSEKVAVRPDFAFVHSTYDSDLGDASSDSVGLGASVLVYLKKWENSAAYFAPRFAWSHASSESEADFGGFESKSSGDAYTYSGSFGAQGWIGRRFSAYGEVGLSYSTGTSESEVSERETTSGGFNIRSGVGVVLYF